jgi:hypothetical protein
MSFKDILSKKPEDLSAEEKAFVREHKSVLSAEEATALASVLDGAGETDEEKAAREAKAAEEKAAADEAAAAAKAEAERHASEKNSGENCSPPHTHHYLPPLLALPAPQAGRQVRDPIIRSQPHLLQAPSTCAAVVEGGTRSLGWAP